MNPQETIETIKIAIAEVEWNYPMEYAIAFENAISALEKQIPKKPDICGEDLFICPNCKLELFSSEEFETNKYCYNCGQALDWSDTE